VTTTFGKLCYARQSDGAVVACSDAAPLPWFTAVPTAEQSARRVHEQYAQRKPISLVPF
jgi:hypothetical protein